MNQKKSLSAKCYNSFYFILVISFLILSFTINSKVTKFSIMPDELLYYSYAQSFFEKHSFSAMNINLDFQKILYSILISPAFAASSIAVRFRIITVINSIMLVSGAAPVYLISQKYVNKLHQMLCVLMYLLNPNMAWSATVMSENLYLPLSLWVMLIIIKLIDSVDKIFTTKDNLISESDNVLRSYYTISIFAGIFIFILFTCKETALFIPFAFIIYLAVKVIHRIYLRQINYKIILQLLSGLIFLAAGFILPYIILRYLVFPDTFDSYISTAATRYFSANHLANTYFYIYYVIYFILIVTLAYTIFPFLLCRSGLKSMTNSGRHLFYFLIIYIVSASFIIAYTITMHEDWVKSLPNVHMRYICMCFPLLFILMINVLERDYIIIKRSMIAAVLIQCWYFYYFIFESHSVVNGYSIGSEELTPLSLNQNIQIWIMIVYSLAVIIGVVMLYKSKHHADIYIILLLISVNIAGLISGWNSNVHSRTPEEEDMKVFESLLNFEQDNNNKNILVIGNDYTDSLLFTALSANNVDFIDSEFFNENYRTGTCNKNMTWKEASLNKCIKNLIYRKYYNISNVDYIIFCNEKSKTYTDSDLSDLLDITEESSTNTDDNGSDYITTATISSKYAKKINIYTDERYDVYQLNDNSKIPEIKFTLQYLHSNKTKEWYE